MPIMRCYRNGVPGWKFGKGGFCYTGAGARAKAREQGAAIKIRQRSDASTESILNNIVRRRAFMDRLGRAPGNPPVWLYPQLIENEYRRALLKFVNMIEQQTRAIIFPHLQDLIDQRNAQVKIADSRADSWSDSVERLIGALELGINSDKTIVPETLTMNIGQKTSEWNDREWRKTLKKVMGIDLVQSEPWLTDTIASFSKQNVALIVSIKDKSVTDIEGMVQRGIAGGERNERIRQEIIDQFGITRSRASLIARDQISKLNGQLTQTRQESFGITKYRWRTSGDERVRETHRAHEGKIFSWDNPPFDTGHPGQDYQCRCTAEPVFADLIDQIEEQEEKIDPIAIAKAQSVRRRAEITPKSISEFEDKYRLFPIEWANCSTRSGKTLFEKTDNATNYIKFSNDQIELMKGNILSHNHPRGTSFSDSDIGLAMKAKVQETRIAAKQYNYSMKAGRSEWTEKFYINSVMPEFQKMNIEFRTELIKKIESGEKTREFANLNHNHIIWTRLAKKFGFKYSRRAVK